MRSDTTYGPEDDTRGTRFPRLAAGPKVRPGAGAITRLVRVAWANFLFARALLAKQTRANKKFAHATRTILLLSGALLAPGCAAPARVPDPLTRGPLGKADDANARSEFWYQLARRPAVSNDEAFHALLLYFAGPAAAPADYAGRLAALQSRGMLPVGFDRPADEVVERGTVAVAVAEGAAIKGGVTARLLGPTPR